jgi:hypothetical protein
MGYKILLFIRHERRPVWDIKSFYVFIMKDDYTLPRDACYFPSPISLSFRSLSRPHQCLIVDLSTTHLIHDPCPAVYPVFRYLVNTCLTLPSSYQDWLYYLLVHFLQSLLVAAMLPTHHDISESSFPLSYDSYSYFNIQWH